MSTLTIRIPEAKHSRLRRLAEGRGLSMNKLNAELRFYALASKGSAKRGIELLDKLDRRPRGR